MFKVKQVNLDNNFGFERVSGKDIGLDENGNLAQGYQHHDALWFPNSPMERSEATTTLQMQETLNYFNIIFNKLTSNIINAIKPKKVLDLGCGSGQLTHMLRMYGIDTVTVDANKETVHSPYTDENHFIARTDKPLEFVDEEDNPVIFDLVISLEHFEHVSPETFDTLMNNIVKHTKSGSILICTAAGWAYDGDKEHIHCNVRDEEYWHKYISSFGFEIIPNMFQTNRAGNNTEIFAKRV